MGGSLHVGNSTPCWCCGAPNIAAHTFANYRQFSRGRRDERLPRQRRRGPHRSSFLAPTADATHRPGELDLVAGISIEAAVLAVLACGHLDVHLGWLGFVRHGERANRGR
jgi:hypothetical protein